MAALDPAIHVFVSARSLHVDARVKRGHDGIREAQSRISGAAFSARRA